MHVSTNLDVDLVAVEADDQVNLLLELQAPQLPRPGHQGRADPGGGPGPVGLDGRRAVGGIAAGPDDIGRAS